MLVLSPAWTAIGVAVMAGIVDRSLYSDAEAERVETLLRPFGMRRIPMDTQDLGSLLDRIRVIRHPCDLDLLIFLQRHPCALLTSEQLAACLGYDRARVAKSLDALLEAGLLTQSRNTSRAARLYVLELHGFPGWLLSSLLIVAATCEGRRRAMRLLESGSDPAPSAALRHHASMADSRVA